MHILVALLIMVMMSTAILGNLMLGGIKIYALSLVFMAIIAFFELLKNRVRIVFSYGDGVLNCHMVYSSSSLRFILLE